jgi:hypothetical protein
VCLVASEPNRFLCPAKIDSHALVEMNSSASAVTLPRKLSIDWKRLVRKAINVTVVTVVFGWLYGWASPWAFPKGTRAGFTWGILHGGLMPLSLPSLVVGKDVPIYAPENTGRFYKIGYICGVNICGLAFFGSAFWQPRRKEAGAG